MFSAMVSFSSSHKCLIPEPFKADNKGLKHQKLRYIISPYFTPASELRNRS